MHEAKGQYHHLNKFMNLCYLYFSQFETWIVIMYIYVWFLFQAWWFQLFIDLWLFKRLNVIFLHTFKSKYLITCSFILLYGLKKQVVYISSSHNPSKSMYLENNVTHMTTHYLYTQLCIQMCTHIVLLF